MLACCLAGVGLHCLYLVRSLVRGCGGMYRLLVCLMRMLGTGGRWDAGLRGGQAMRSARGAGNLLWPTPSNPLGLQLPLQKLLSRTGGPPRLDASSRLGQSGEGTLTLHHSPSSAPPIRDLKHSTRLALAARTKTPGRLDSRDRGGGGGGGGERRGMDGRGGDDGRPVAFYCLPATCCDE